jgi:hypothetical protein
MKPEDLRRFGRAITASTAWSGDRPDGERGKRRCTPHSEINTKEDKFITIEDDPVSSQESYKFRSMRKKASHLPGDFVQSCATILTRSWWEKFETWKLPKSRSLQP